VDNADNSDDVDDIDNVDTTDVNVDDEVALVFRGTVLEQYDERRVKYERCHSIRI